MLGELLVSLVIPKACSSRPAAMESPFVSTLHSQAITRQELVVFKCVSRAKPFEKPFRQQIRQFGQEWRLATLPKYGVRLEEQAPQSEGHENGQKRLLG